MLSNVIIAASLATAFILAFEACLAWLCAALARVSNISIMRSMKLLIYEVFIPVPVGAIIGYAVGCVLGGPAGIQAGLLSGLGFSLYLFLAIARSVYETSYARAAVFSAIFIAANTLLCLTLSSSPSINSLRETIISWPK